MLPLGLDWLFFVTARSAPIHYDATRDLVKDDRGVSQFCPGDPLLALFYLTMLICCRRGLVISVGGPMFVQYIRPSEEELFKVSDTHLLWGHMTQCDFRIQSQSLLVCS